MTSLTENDNILQEEKLMNIPKLDNANSALGISNDFTLEKNKNLIFVFTSQKVGSTSLVSSFRLNGAGKFTVIHIHNELMLKVLYGITEVSVMDIIEYNKMLGKNVYVFDIFRSPIEQKISIFFENINTYHFNAPIDVIKEYDIERIIKRFNELFPHIQTNDHFRNKYKLRNIPEKFDTIDKKLVIVQNGITFVKLRLKDSSEWTRILNNIFGYNIYIVNDYETDKKDVNEIYMRFKKNYRLPINYYNNFLKDNKNLNYYYSTDELTEYLQLWSNKLDQRPFKCFSEDEYKLYSNITRDNQYMSEIHHEHYIDLGCLCNACCRQRGLFLIRLKNGEKITEKINHYVAVQNYINMKARQVPILIVKRPIRRRQTLVRF
jgi:hypothetical protein